MKEISRGRAAPKHVILFLAANPRDTGRLALDREARTIHVELKSPLWPERPAQLSRVDVTPLRGTALREAIAAPAEGVGVTVEPELIKRLIADAASEPGILPLLQEALVQLWDARADQTLTLADYQALDAVTFEPGVVFG